MPRGISINGTVPASGSGEVGNKTRRGCVRGSPLLDLRNPYFRVGFLNGNVPRNEPGGEFRVENQRLSWEILDAFREACAQTGIPKVTDFNTGNDVADLRSFGLGAFAGLDNDGDGRLEVGEGGGQVTVVAPVIGALSLVFGGGDELNFESTTSLGSGDLLLV